MNKRALITGVTGQDGSYLTELLLRKGYEVHGVRRRVSLFNTSRIDHIFNDPHTPGSRFFMHYGDLADSSTVYKLISEVRPDEVYNLGAQSHVAVSFDIPEHTADVDGLGTLRILEAIRRLSPRTKFYQASSSEMFGNSPERPQKENTPFYPRSPYGCAKVFSYWVTRNYREAYDIFAANGILFNHESPRRGRTFVTRKISRAVARIKLGIQDILYLGNLNSLRDWGFAGDYVEAMWLMLQSDNPDDFVIATGEAHSVREFTEKAFNEVGIRIKWSGSGLDETGTDLASGRPLVKVDPLYFRPSEVDYLLGDSSKARTNLGWFPRKSFEELVSEMVKFDLENEAKANGWKSY